MQGVSIVSPAENQYCVHAHKCGLSPPLSSTQPTHTLLYTPRCLYPLATCVKLVFLTIALSNHMIKIDTEKSHYLSKECDEKANQQSLGSNLNRWLSKLLHALTASFQNSPLAQFKVPEITLSSGLQREIYMIKPILVKQRCSRNVNPSQSPIRYVYILNEAISFLFDLFYHPLQNSLA